MSDGPHTVDVSSWVSRAAGDPVAHRQRQVIEVILNAIALTAPLNTGLYLKGGILLGLAYGSARQTMDIDFTATLPVDDEIDAWIRDRLNTAFPRATAALGYADLVVRAQSVKRLPGQNRFASAAFPALKIRIAHAHRGSNEERALREGGASSVVDVDVSFNEPLRHVQILRLTGGGELLSYGLIEIAAEKYRDLLQQEVRNRNRRQDVYDLDMLIRGGMMNQIDPGEFLDALVEKCAARRIEAHRESFDDAEIKRRAGRDWASMKLELEDLPDFEDCYEKVSAYYRSLPWED